MIRYFVIAADGQKYGPADVATLNNWIAEGRLQSQSLLQEENSSLQVEARGVPALKFVPRTVGTIPTPPPAPQTPGPSSPGFGNPYDAPRPMGPSQPQPFSSNYPRGPQFQPKPAMSGQLVWVWVCTIVAPFLVFFFFIGGLITSSYGLRGGIAMYSAGYRTQGIILIALNAIWLALWIITRFVIPVRLGPFR